MAVRLNYWKVAPKMMEAMLGLENYLASIRNDTLEDGLVELVKTRVSQMNGCAFCIDMHTRDTLAQGEDLRRLLVLSAWREAPLFTPREQAALAWAEALMYLDGQPVPDELFEATREHFTEKALADLTLVICAINSWNRLALAFGSQLPDIPTASS